MVVDTVTDPTEPDQKTVKTREAEVRDVQSREFYSFATRGGKHEVQRGEFYINVKRGKIYINVKKGEIYVNMKEVVSQPIANYIVVEYGDAVKHVVAEDMLRPLRLAKENMIYTYFSTHIILVYYPSSHF
jgi:hypothetical protein